MKLFQTPVTYHTFILEFYNLHTSDNISNWGIIKTCQTFCHMYKRMWNAKKNTNRLKKNIVAILGDEYKKIKINSYRIDCNVKTSSQQLNYCENYNLNKNPSNMTIIIYVQYTNNMVESDLKLNNMESPKSFGNFLVIVTDVNEQYSFSNIESKSLFSTGFDSKVRKTIALYCTK